ncbi:hypothetical protein FRC14_004067 [Serendipita sp. 396]|nr:hypothetical protein FRC14_004067 [Serendipita sp. 396]KAG8783612.1 hypothetical protein FRC15_004860 [Serendipita sp. 397]KAG8801103.1 hypothetical protein FRC16_001301 [Serendipita sp. 398]KAG8826708.1 hypothetical protein FRC19_007942 [Serendipita sp. 401]KAG8839320.1 hypothetical protein FRB91_007065 [Serendipita sp. 411]KAG8867615.1 hypothetical protein FRC20_005339 [Serendipita sp. 405]KAG9056845.1 hypothetical protein FS842_009365 [Serendipita sp. 407]
MRQFAAPLKVSASSKGNDSSTNGTGTNATSNSNNNNNNAGGNNTSTGAGSLSPLGPSKVEDITSPHELTAFVEQLLNQIEAKFDDMSGQILDRMNAMSTRVDALEGAIQDLISSSDYTQPQPGTPGTPAR